MFATSLTPLVLHPKILTPVLQLCFDTHLGLLISGLAKSKCVGARYVSVGHVSPFLSSEVTIQYWCDTHCGIITYVN